MGKQVNYFMTERDEAQFLELVLMEHGVCIIPYTLSTAKISCLTELPDLEEPFWGSVWLWNRALSPSPQLKYVTEQGYWVVDELESEVIKFSRSYVDRGRLVRGRIWAEFVVWSLAAASPERRRKGDAFEKWFERLARWIKTRSIRDANGDYVMPGAAEYQRNGGQLVQAVFADSIKMIRHNPDLC